MFGRKKMYKKGLADAMQAYEAFGKKQEEALAFMREEVRSGNKELKDALAGLGEDLNGIYQYLNAQEKAALYQLSTPMDIKELDDEEKRLLLAVLYQLAENEGSALTDDQQAYIRSVQKYLEITNPQTFADLAAIENIDSIDVQKTFLRVILEFFYLQDGDELSDEQDEIFDYFSVNKKQATIVENEVSRLFNAVGPEGVAEKYGYVPEETEEQDIIENNRPDSHLSVQRDDDYELEECDVIKFIGSTYSAMPSKFVQTENYILFSGPNFKDDTVRRFDKRTKAVDEYPCPQSSCISSIVLHDLIHTEIFGDKLMWWWEDRKLGEIYLYLLDVSTLPQPPIQIFSYKKVLKDEGVYVVFNEKLFVVKHCISREINYYDINKGQLFSIPFDTGMDCYGSCFLVVDDKIYFASSTSKNNYWSNSLICYDTTTNSFKRIGSVPHQTGGWCRVHNLTFINDIGYPSGNLYYVELSEDNFCCTEFLNNIRCGTSFYRTKNGMLFIDENCGYTLQYVDFEEWSIAQLSPLTFHLNYGQFFSIGDWVYYNPNTAKHGWMKIRLSDPDLTSQPTTLIQ